MSINFEVHREKFSSDDWSVYVFPGLWYQKEAFMRASWHSLNICFLIWTLKVELELERRR